MYCPRMAARLLPAMVLILGGGCASIGLFETARTCDAGRAELTLSYSPVSVNAPSFALFPLFKPTVRYGVLDGLDIGVSLPGLAPAIGVSGKKMFLRNDGLDGAAYLGTEFYLLSSDMYETSYLSGLVNPRVVLSREQEGTFPFAANAGLSLFWLFDAGSTDVAAGSALWVNAGAGLPIRLGERREYRILPAFEVAVPVYVRIYEEGMPRTGRISLSIGIGGSLTGSGWRAVSR